MANLHRMFGPGGKLDPIGAWAERKLGITPKKPPGPIRSLNASEIAGITASIGGAPVTAARRRPRSIINPGGGRLGGT